MTYIDALCPARWQVKSTAGPETKAPARSSLKEQRILSADGYMARGGDDVPPPSDADTDAPPPPHSSKQEL